MKAEYASTLVIGDFEVEDQLFSACLQQFLREVVVCGDDPDEIRARTKNQPSNLAFINFDTVRNLDALLPFLKYKWTTVIFPEHDSATISSVLQAGADDFLVRPLTSLMIAKRLTVWTELIGMASFSALFSHEVKVPLTSIQGYTELLLSDVAGNLTDQQRNFLTTISINAKRQIRLINLLAEKARVENPKFRFYHGENSKAREVFIRTAEQLKSQFASKDQTFKLLIPDDLSAVLMDEYSIEHMLAVLLENANLYTPENGEIVLSVKNIVEDSNPFVQVSVKDTGIGISTDEHGRIFQAWFRSENATSVDFHAYGLSLYLAKRRIEAHGGRIWFESQPGEGTTFHFIVPAAVT